MQVKVNAYIPLLFMRVEPCFTHYPIFYYSFFFFFLMKVFNISFRFMVLQYWHLFRVSGCSQCLMGMAVLMWSVWWCWGCCPLTPGRVFFDHLSGYSAPFLYLPVKCWWSVLEHFFYHAHPFWEISLTCLIFLYSWPEVLPPYSWASLVTQLVKNLPAMQETWVWSLGWEDPLEKRKATHASILAWDFLGLYSPWDNKEWDTAEPLFPYSWLPNRYLLAQVCTVNLASIWHT